jgi:hypothetical protein
MELPPLVTGYFLQICRKQPELILYHENENVRRTVQGEAQGRKYKTLKHGGCHEGHKSFVPSLD